MSLPKEPEEFPKYPPPRITKGRRDVVTAFLQRPSDKAILLVQRSIKVSTYQLHWGGVSGGLEGETESCLFRATQEIQEEVGLFPSQFRFVRRGRPLYVDDGPLRFTVHPLLFVLEENSCQIVLNWENLNARFFPINDIRSLLSTVPKLYETVERVVVSERQERALGRLIQDRSHGAAELALWAIDALRDEIENQRSVYQPTDEATYMLCSIRNFTYHLATCRPRMAPLATSSVAILASVHDALHARAGPFEMTVQELASELIRGVDTERERLMACQARLQEHASRVLHSYIFAKKSESTANSKKTTAATVVAAANNDDDNGHDYGNYNTSGRSMQAGIMTTSKSSTVTTCLLNTIHAIACEEFQNEKETSLGDKAKTLEIFVCESRPLCEGVDVAIELARNGGTVTVITDAQASVFLAQHGVIDVVLLGADAIGGDGVVNKCGSRMLALMAKAAGVPVYVLADSSKIAVRGGVAAVVHGGGDEQGEEEKSVGEVMDGWNAVLGDGGKAAGDMVAEGKLSVRNVYFEEVPLELISGVVTENGMLDMGGIEGMVSEWSESVHKAFGLL